MRGDSCKRACGFGNVLLCVLPEPLLFADTEQRCQVPKSVAREQPAGRGITWPKIGVG